MTTFGSICNGGCAAPVTTLNDQSVQAGKLIHHIEAPQGAMDARHDADVAAIAGSAAVHRNALVQQGGDGHRCCGGAHCDLQALSAEVRRNERYSTLADVPAGGADAGSEQGATAAARTVGSYKLSGYLKYGAIGAGVLLAAVLLASYVRSRRGKRGCKQCL